MPPISPHSPHGSTRVASPKPTSKASWSRSEEHTSELQSHLNLVCRLLLEKKKNHQDVPFRLQLTHKLQPRAPKRRWTIDITFEDRRCHHFQTRGIGEPEQLPPLL